MPRQLTSLAFAAALILCHSSARAEMQRLRVCIGENASRCDGTFSDFYKAGRGTKGDVEHIAGNAICTTAKGHLLSVNADDARETHDGYIFVTIECEIDPVSQLAPSRKR
jgi:hypothetical protein